MDPCTSPLVPLDKAIDPQVADRGRNVVQTGQRQHEQSRVPLSPAGLVEIVAAAAALTEDDEGLGAGGGGGAGGRADGHGDRREDAAGALGSQAGPRQVGGGADLAAAPGGWKGDCEWN